MYLCELSVYFQVSYLLDLFVCREFVTLCGKALEINAVLIKPDQEMYQEDLKSKYEDLTEKLAPFVAMVGCVVVPT